MRFLRTAPLIAAFWLVAGVSLAAPPVVMSTSPVSNSMAPATTTISITFDQALLPSIGHSIDLRVFGKQTGRTTGAIAFSNGDKTVTFTPTEPFSAGELVLVNLSHAILAADRRPSVRPATRSSSSIQTQPAARAFDAIQTHVEPDRRRRPASMARPPPT